MSVKRESTVEGYADISVKGGGIGDWLSLIEDKSTSIFSLEKVTCTLLSFIYYYFSLVNDFCNYQRTRQIHSQILDMFWLADSENLIRKEETYYQGTTNPQDCQ